MRTEISGYPPLISSRMAGKRNRNVMYSRYAIIDLDVSAGICRRLWRPDSEVPDRCFHNTLQLSHSLDYLL